MSIADDLEKVLFGVADKWCQGTVDDGYGNHCLLGWAGYVEKGNPNYCTAIEGYLNDFLLGYSDNDTTVIFNDSHTQQEVIWMLEEAIDDARERGLRHRNYEVCAICQEPWPCLAFKQWYIDRGKEVPTSAF